MRDEEQLWQEFENLEKPPIAGRRLDVGGFVQAAPFETILRRISAEYLREAWECLSSVLERHAFELPDDLSWGCMRAGETNTPGMVPHLPSSFTGWTSRRLDRFYEEARFTWIDRSLRSGSPALQYGATWRSSKWKIDPDDYELALRLVEVLWKDEVADWNPKFLLEDRADQPEQEGAWLEVARAIRDDDQREVDLALAKSRESYSMVGYRIVV